MKINIDNEEYLIQASCFDDEFPFFVIKKDKKITVVDEEEFFYNSSLIIEEGTKLEDLKDNEEFKRLIKRAIKEA